MTVFFANAGCVVKSGVRDGPLALLALEVRRAPARSHSPLQDEEAGARCLGERLRTRGLDESYEFADTASVRQ
jgi:hypothetical protein